MARKKDRGIVLRGNVWHYNYVDRVTGKRIQRSSGTHVKQKAMQLREQEMADSWDQEKLGIAPNKTVNEIFEYCWENYWRFKKKADKNNRILATAVILREFGERVASTITAEELRTYMARRLDGEIIQKVNENSLKIHAVQVSSIKREFTHLSCAFNQAVKNKLLKENPFKAIDSDLLAEDDLSRDRIASPEEISLFLGHSAGMMNKIIEFDLNCGLRQGQIRNLKKTDLDLVRRTMAVSCYKGRKPKHYNVPIFNRAMEILIEVLAASPDDSEYVFTNHEGKQIPRNGMLHSSFTRLVERLGIQDFVFHDLRHTFATDFYNKTKDLKGIQMILGHSSSKTTERYLNLKDEDLVPRGNYEMTYLRDKNVTVENEQIEKMAKMLH